METGAPASAQTFGTLNHDLFDLYMRTNALGPLKVAEAFLPNVAASKLKKIVNISSSSGMVSRPPPHSGNMWYRASKTALNGLMVSIVPAARDAGVSVTQFEPGWTWTGQDESIRDPEQHEPAEVVAAMIETIAGLTLQDTGRFMTREGETQPW
jgi:NAD(P)-dependent dehydrogenase (short-subunit alcohol dehydrogenase family)